MAVKLKSLLAEQTVSIAPNNLDGVIKMHRDIFAKTLNQLDQVPSDNTDASQLLQNNVKELCEAYIAYCDNTINTIKENPGAPEDAIVTEHVVTMIDRIGDKLEY